MKVYVLRGGWNYEDGDVLATFTDGDKAKKMEAFMDKYGKHDWYRLEESNTDEVTLD